MPLDFQSWTRRRKWLALLGVMLSFCALLYCLLSSSRHTNAMDIDTAIHSPHTLCVGRYLIDVPANFELEHYDYVVNGVDFSWLYGVSEVVRFDEELEKRKSELSTKTNEYRKPSLESAAEIPLDSGMRAIILRHSRLTPVEWTEKGQNMKSDDALTVEGWLWTGRHAFKLVENFVSPQQADEVVVQFLKRMKHLQHGIPNEEGFCMEMFDARVMLSGPPQAGDLEGAEVQFGLKDHPDVKFRLDLTPTSDRKTEPLSARHARANAAMSSVQWRFSTLREKQRSVGPMDGYEIIEAAREENFTRSLGFDWEWLGRPNDPLAPEIHLEAKTGYSRNGPVGSSLSDKDALKLWDMVTGSIRLRPTSAPPKAVKPAAINVSPRRRPGLPRWEHWTKPNGFIAKSSAITTTPIHMLSTATTTSTCHSALFAGRASGRSTTNCPAAFSAPPRPSPS